MCYGQDAGAAGHPSLRFPTLPPIVVFTTDRMRGWEEEPQNEKGRIIWLLLQLWIDAAGIAANREEEGERSGRLLPDGTLLCQTLRALQCEPRQAPKRGYEQPVKEQQPSPYLRLAHWLHTLAATLELKAGPQIEEEGHREEKKAQKSRSFLFFLV